MSRLSRTGVLATLALTTLLATGCSAAAPASSDAPSGSAGSGTAQLTVYTSEPQEKIDALVAAFTAENPEIAVDVYRAGTGDLTTRIEAERTAGEIQADVLLAADAPTFEGYAAEDLLLKYSPAEVDALNPDVVDPEGYYTGTRIIPTVIAYNTTAIETPPASWQDLTDTAYAGSRIVMPNPDVSGAAAFNAAVWLDDDRLGEDWLGKLAANTPVIAESNGPVAQAVASGAQPVGIVVDYLVRELAAAGSPIAVAYPEEGSPYVSQPAGIFADTDQPEAAQAFVDFLVSEAGQSLAVEQSYLPVRSDVGTPAGAPAMSEIALISPDLERIGAIKADSVATFSELFQ